MKKIFIVLLAVAFAAPFFTACKKGEEDPGLSFRSRDNRLIGEWSLSTMDGTTTESEQSTDTWKGTDSYTKNTTTTDAFSSGSMKTTENTSYTSVSSNTYTATTVHTSYESFTVDLTIDENGSATIKYSSSTNSTAGTFTISSSPSNSGDVFSNDIDNPYYDWSSGTSPYDDGTYNQDIYSAYTSTGSYAETGPWYWNDQDDSKNSVVITPFSEISDNDAFFEIVKLSSEELKLKVSYSTDYSSNSANSDYNTTSQESYSSTVEEIWLFTKK